MTLTYDLHCHSTVSDGVLTPAAVVERAHANGVDVLALTDHDETSGLAPACQRALELGLHFVPGVEVSVTWAGHTLHIVGLQVDPSSSTLNDGLATIRRHRQSRAHEMADRLETLGFQGAYDGAMRFVSNPALISRTHFARFLVQEGHCRHMQEVFDRYLGDQQPANVPMQWATLEEAMSWIHAAGGTSVIAHPGRYRLTPLQFDSLFNQFSDLGGRAIEVITGSHRVEQFDEYANVARRFGFRASVGSDFHEPSQRRRDLGELPALPRDLTPVWHDWGIQ